jgi:hypothetical protein
MKKGSGLLFMLIWMLFTRQLNRWTVLNIATDRLLWAQTPVAVEAVV